MLETNAGPGLRHLGSAFSIALVLIGAAVSAEEPLPEPGAESDLQYFLSLEEQLLEQALNSPVVTASGTAETRATSAANVVSVTREQMARRGWRTLAEVLANVPGLYVIDDRVTPSVGVRGVTGGLRAGSRIVRVMINGVPVNFRPDLTAFLGPEYIPIETVERVEIARGPLSALYGANAFLATVNVITRHPARGTSAEVTGRGHIVEGQAGSGLSGMVTHSSEHVELLVAASRDDTDRSGARIDRTFDGQNPDLGTYAPFFAESSRNDRAAPHSVYAQLGLNSEKLGRLVVQGGLQQLDSMGEFQLNSVLTHKNRISVQNLWTSARYERKLTDRISSWAQGGWSQGAPTRDEILSLTGNNNYSFKRNFGYSAFDLGAGIDVTPMENVAINAGVDFSREDHQVLYYTQVFNVAEGLRVPGESIDLVSDQDQKEALLISRGAYVQVSGSPSGVLSNLRLTGNFRLDAPSHFPLQHSWRAVAAYRWNDDWTTRLIIGRAYQTPSAVLMFGLPGFGLGNNVIGNRTQANLPPLNPQIVHSAEAVVSARIFGSAVLDASVYAQELDDKIEFVQLSNNFIARNQGMQRIVGFDANLHMVFRRFEPFLAISAQRLLDGDTNQMINPPSLFPEFWALAGVNVAVPELYFNFNGQVRWVGARGASQSNALLNNFKPYVLPPYATVDLALSSVDLHLLGGQAETKVLLKAQNLLDHRYSEPGFGGHDLPGLGRTFLLELRQSL